MRKYAAVTALVIVLITGLALTVSASAGTGVGVSCSALQCKCNKLCNIELWNTAKLWDRTSFIQSKPLRDACRAKCVAAKEAAQHYYSRVNVFRLTDASD
jgi:hypothetical protein